MVTILVAGNMLISFMADSEDKKRIVQLQKESVSIVVSDRGDRLWCRTG